MDRNDQPPEQPTPALPEPPYARQVLTTMADELERARNRRTLLTDVNMRRAFTVAVAVRCHMLPALVANQVAETVDAQLPAPDPAATHGSYATQLRQLAQQQTNNNISPANADRGATVDQLHAHAHTDYATAGDIRARMDKQDRGGH